jgi:very-short-patch-repair endonuclease
MLKYNHRLKGNARHLRTNMTDSEQKLWTHLRRKQLLGVQFYRQKPMGDFIVDFYAPKVKLAIEVDGSQHLEPDHVQKDLARQRDLQNQGLLVLRFHNLQVLQEIDGVMERIYGAVASRLKDVKQCPH